MENQEDKNLARSAITRLGESLNLANHLLVTFNDKIEADKSVDIGSVRLLVKSVDQLITCHTRSLEALSLMESELKHVRATNDLLLQTIASKK